MVDHIFYALLRLISTLGIILSARVTDNGNISEAIGAWVIIIAIVGLSLLLEAMYHEDWY
jgi:hypothetical protein